MGFWMVGWFLWAIVLEFIGTIILVLLVGIVLAGLSFALRWRPWLFLFLWFISPCLSWITNYKSASSLFTDKGLQVLRFVFIGVVVVISLLFWMTWDNLRDDFGNSCVKGYSVYYTDEVDNEGDYYEQAHISANSWFIEKFLILSKEVFLLPLATCNVILAWMGVTKEIKRRNLKKSTND